MGPSPGKSRALKNRFREVSGPADGSGSRLCPCARGEQPQHPASEPSLPWGHLSLS